MAAYLPPWSKVQVNSTRSSARSEYGGCSGYHAILTIPWYVGMSRDESCKQMLGEVRVSIPGAQGVPLRIGEE